MPKYINADELIKAIETELWDWETVDGIKSSTVLKQTISDIKNMPAADVVEVVRKPIVGYEGYYEVDNFGRVYSVDRVVPVDDNGRIYDKPLKGKQIKQHIHSKGYKIVALTKNGKTKNIYVHRIVAEAFLENPNKLPMVNHKDEDKTNNFVENLEWCSNKYNVNYGNARKKQAKALRGRKHTEEHNKKISESVKRYYGERKESKVKKCFDIPKEVAERLLEDMGRKKAE